VDDTSRLSRTQYEQMRFAAELKFYGVRLVAVSQGIDSQDEQSDVMFTVHGLIDSLYLKELAKKTHRGLEGLALKGLHTGGRVFGYDAVEAPDNRKQLMINPEEAKIILRIFEMAAKGTSLKKITAKLNKERVPSPRPGTRKKYDTWCLTAIREMLRRELYVGVIVWNKRKYIKRPGTNKRVARPRPESDWMVCERPDLRIVSEELWDAVQKRVAYTMKLYSEGAKKGLARRCQASEYILSGAMKCAKCGSDLVLIGGRGTKYSRYGCSQRWNRGSCDNDLTIRRSVAEQHFFQTLQAYAEEPDAINFVVDEFARQLKAARGDVPGAAHSLTDSKEQMVAELQRLTTAIAQGTPASAVKNAIRERQRDLRIIERKLKDAEPVTIGQEMEQLRRFAIQKILNIVELFRSKADNAKYEFSQHCGELWMTPLKTAEGERFYAGVGQWNLLGFMGGGDLPPLRAPHMSIDLLLPVQLIV
jgi:site-specific DNA recombinase